MSSNVDYKLFLDSVAQKAPKSAVQQPQDQQPAPAVPPKELVDVLKQKPMTFLEIMNRFSLDFNDAQSLVETLQRTNQIRKTVSGDGRERYEAVA
jgi:hypothetical protein